MADDDQRRTDPARDEGKPGAGTPPSRRDTGAESKQRTPMTQQLGRIAVIAILVLFTIFAVVNSHYVTFEWVFGETQVEQVVRDGEIQRQTGGVPLIILLIVSFALGAVVGWFVQWRSARPSGGKGKAGGGSKSTD